MKRNGFTLLELLVVIAIMGIVMGSSIASYFAINQGARLRSAVNTVQSSFALARQRSILNQIPLSVVFTNDLETGRWAYQVQGEESGQRYGEAMHLPLGIDFEFVDPEDADRITFRPSGAAVLETATVALSEPGNPKQWELTVYGLTGLVTVELGENEEALP